MTKPDYTSNPTDSSNPDDNSSPSCHANASSKPAPGTEIKAVVDRLWECVRYHYDDPNERKRIWDKIKTDSRSLSAARQGLDYLIALRYEFWSECNIHVSQIGAFELSCIKEWLALLDAEITYSAILASDSESDLSGEKMAIEMKEIIERAFERAKGAKEAKETKSPKDLEMIWGVVKENLDSFSTKAEKKKYLKKLAHDFFSVVAVRYTELDNGAFVRVSHFLNLIKIEMEYQIKAFWDEQRESLFESTQASRALLNEAIESRKAYLEGIRKREDSFSDQMDQFRQSLGIAKQSSSMHKRKLIWQGLRQSRMRPHHLLT